MQTIKLNKTKSRLFMIYNGVRLDSISFVNEVNVKSSYNLIRMDNRDGFILDDKNSIDPINRQVTFYTNDLNKIRNIFKFNKIVDIYINNEKYFYRGFTENINYKYFKANYYEVVISLILQPYILENEKIIILNKNGSINNIGEFKAYPIMEITPNAKKFSISISKKTMKFKVENTLDSKYIVDLDNIEITKSDGSLCNSIFQKDSDFLHFDVGINPVVLNGISEVKFKINWRYLYNDLFERQ